LQKKVLNENKLVRRSKLVEEIQGIKKALDPGSGTGTLISILGEYGYGHELEQKQANISTSRTVVSSVADP
jgi:hypothetical protein